MGKPLKAIQSFVFLLALFICHTSYAQPVNLQEQLSRRHWQTEKVSKGIVWKYYHGNGLFDSRQSINVLDINLNKAEIDVSFAYADSGLVKTSEFAGRQNAIAAVNGSYFDMKNGGSVVFFKADGQLLDTTQQISPYREGAGVAIDASGKPMIVRRPAAGWKTAEAPDVLSAGPLLLYAGEEMPQTQEKFNTNRHPRTAIGLTGDNHLLVVTVDGRTSEAYGMSIGELAQLMRALQCENALNLDGGGSSTMWIQGYGLNGIVNYPCDNKLYDHAGERAVANCILFKRKNE